MTQQRIRQWYEHWDGQVYVSFSGGKDSTVLLHLVRQIYPDVPAVFVNTGLEYPEIVQFVNTFENVEMLRPKMNFRQVITEYGYPVISKEVAHTIHYAKRNDGSRTYKYYMKKLNGTLKSKDGVTKSMYCMDKWKFLLDAPFNLSDECCNVMKKRPVKTYEKETGNMPYLGSMAAESMLRQKNWIRYGCNAFEASRPTSCPLSFWTEQDIYRYIQNNNMPIAKVYGEIVSDDMFGYHLKTTGVNRTGCMFCMFGVHLEPYPNRFQRMKKTPPKLWAYCMDKLGIREVLEYINVPYE